MSKIISYPFIEEGSAFAELEERYMSSQSVATQTSEDHHVAPREAWDAIAADYDRFVAPAEMELATTALRLAGLRAGQSFLDVAAGTGGLSLPAARLGANVVATDWSSRMIERFEARVREQGLTNAEGRVMDCHRLDFGDDTFDLVGSQFGVMLVPDQQRALHEMVRVTKPGGRVLLIAYGSPAEFEALHVFIAGLQAVVPDFEGLPDDPPPLEFQVSDPDVLRSRLIEAGLHDVSVDTAHREKIALSSGQELWDWCLGGNPIPGMLVAELDDRQRAAVVSELDAMLSKRANDGETCVLTAPLNIGIGTK